MYKKADEFTPFKIEILCTPQAVEELLPLLRRLQYDGAVGHSCSIVVDLDMRERKENFFFDGDGNSSIDEINISRLHWQTCHGINTHRGRMRKDGKYWKTIEEEKKQEEESMGKCLTAQAKDSCEPGCQCEKQDEKS